MVADVRECWRRLFYFAHVLFVLPFATTAIHSAGYDAAHSSKSSESAINRIDLLLPFLPCCCCF
jgi:hypothetical protein